MDGPFYVDTRAPHCAANYPSVTLATTVKALAPAYAYPKLGPNYMGWVGKAVRLTVMGMLTTGTTPGAIITSLYWGTGADGTGSGTIVESANITATANMSGCVFKAEWIIRCRAIGTSGSVMVSGLFACQTWGFFMLPPQNNTATTVDLTQDYIFYPQMSRSGSTSESVQVTDLTFEALN